MANEIPSQNPSTVSDNAPPHKPDPSSQEETLPPPTEPSQGTAPPPQTEFRSSGSPADQVFPAIPGYELQQELGRGAMGVVFKALQVHVKRVVALKMILSGTHAGTAEIQRFRIEAEAAARLDHLAIVPIYEVGEHQGNHFFSMKLIEGGTLASRMAEFSLPQAEHNSIDRADRQVKIAALLAKVAEAIQCAHEHGILHRDLKPGNILLDARVEPHVADFGLAKRVEGESVLTQTGVIVGTPSYMAPEQASGRKKLTPAADIYSLGAILYELLTGRPVFKGETVMETLVQVMEHEPVGPRSVNRSVSRDLETICLKALAKDPDKRYRSAQEMAEELKRYAAGQPIKTRPAGWLKVAWRRCRRNPVVTGLTGALLVLLLTVTGLLVGRSQPDPAPLNDGSLDRVKTAGKIVIAIDTNYPPMEFLKDGQLTGFDFELAEQVAARLAVKADFQIVHWDWPEVPQGLNQGKCDMVISSWTITNQRKQDAAFVEYLSMRQVFVCKRGVVVNNEKDLAGKRVAVGADTVQHNYLKAVQEKGIAFKDLIVLMGGEDPFPYMKKGRADVTIVDEPVASYHARQDADFVVTGSIGHALIPPPVGMVFRPKDIQLQEAVAQAIGAMKADGFFDRILEKWFGK
jgi:serine/threonine protein kinase/ABC-type amino acid transport substrate-binding protein